MGKRIVGVRQRGKTTYEISYYDLNGKRQYETVEAASAEKAAAIRETRLGDLARGVVVTSRLNAVRFDELAADVVNDYLVNQHSSTDDIEARFRIHLNPVFGNRKASTITTAAIKGYIVHRQSQQAATGTINRELEAMRRAFNLAVRGKKLIVAPYVPMLRETNVRQGFFTREEVGRLCSFLKEPFASFTMFLFLTGWRYSEVRGLLWRNVDFTTGEIRIETSKNREPRIFPMSDELRALLEALTATPERKGARPAAGHVVIAPRMPAAITPFVFSVNGRQVGVFRKQWKAACHKAGLPCIIGTNGKVLKALRTPHDLRRSFAREMDIHGVRRGAIKKLGGWKTDSVFNRYNIVSESDLKDAIERINRVTGGKLGGNSGSMGS